MKYRRRAAQVLRFGTLLMALLGKEETSPAGF
jgi:hypothetical protein